MNDVEDTVRAATRAYGDIVREVPPLDLAPAPQRANPRPARQRRQSRRFRGWMAPAAAAAAVVAVAVSLVIVRDLPDGSVVRPSGSPVPSSSTAAVPLPAAVPKYYVALAGKFDSNSPYSAILADTATGVRLATVSPPAGSTFAGVTAAADDRTFVLDATTCSRYSASSLLCPRTWYLLRLSPGSPSPAQLTRLPIPPTARGTAVEGIALSPDGRQLAVALQPGMGAGASDHPSSASESLSVYSVTTGALLRTWTGPLGTISFPGELIRLDSNNTVFWSADGRTLTFRNEYVVRTLRTSGPGQNLIAGSRVIWSSPAHGQVRGYQLSCGNTPDAVAGGSLICGASGMPVPPTHVVSKCSKMWDNVMGFLAYSAATGDLERALYIEQTTCTAEVSADVLWASAGGQTMIGWLNSAPVSNPGGPQRNSVGVITGGRFTQIPFPVNGGVPFPNGTVW